VEHGIRVVAVATNRPSCGGASFARERGLALGELSQKAFPSAEARDSAMRDFFISHGVELVVDAGYDRVHTKPFLDAFADRIINVHPSLLPEFAGSMEAIERALESGARQTGATVHLVTATLDAGPILLQEAVPIRDGDTAHTLRERVHRAEYRILPRAVRLMEERLFKGSPRTHGEPLGDPLDGSRRGSSEFAG
jgi:phosphoribosylglycinamide formyltransferase-1